MYDYNHNVVVLVVFILFGQPRNNIIICRVQLGQATSQLCQRTGIVDVRHSFAAIHRRTGQVTTIRKLDAKSLTGKELSFIVQHRS